MDSPADPLEVDKLLAAARRLQAAGNAVAAARAFAAVERLLGTPVVTPGVSRGAGGRRLGPGRVARGT